MKKEETPMEIDTLPIDESTLIIKEKSENIPASSKVNKQNLKKVELPTQSYVLSGSDSRDIHEENLNIMKSMSEEEIREEREKLIATMDPAIVAFLKSRRKKEINENRNPTIKEQNEAASDINIEEIQTPSELLKQPSAEKWLNFDIIETNKLAWMKDMDVPKVDKSKQFEARFDFDGWLLPYSEPEINEKNRILYHHGEEAGRPGYTLQELFQLSRFCLDDNTPAVLNASIKAMRNLIYSQVDETCLDSLLGFGLGHIQPVLAVDNDKEDDNTVNDQQLAEKNIIRCLARTEIFTRIRYIINTVKPSLETVVYCMDILIRLARDSELVYMKILNCEGLIDSIVKYFVPKVFHAATSTSPYELPLLQSIKLLRILSSRSKHIANKFITKFQILDSIILYLSNDTFSSNVNGLRLQTECLHFWSLLVNYRLPLDYLSVIQPVLLNMLDYHFKNTNLDMKTTFVRQGHVAALLIFLGHMAKVSWNLIQPFLPLLLEMCLPKWSTQFMQLNEFACGKLQIISSLLFCLSCIGECQTNNGVDETIINLLNSNGYNNITDKIKSGSMLLNNYETHKPSSNLKSLEAAAWHTMDHVVPVIQTNSCLPFLFGLSQYVHTSKNRKLKIAFLQNTNVQKYLEALQKLR
ncbi:hypothetical protein NQ318_008244 [Aromia moschata]|uniref:RNA polymerase II-associated protein 1 n=1 Tax=Aromia moschata TaxID=1265417 RepID=A0AAV8Y6Y2_9CUCU|nr:hypothetical protein NQ318_008244 [Aromia moschata]